MNPSKREPLAYCLVQKKGSAGETGPRFGTQYDLTDACPRCGTGAKQISPLDVRPSDFAKTRHIVTTYCDEVLFSKALADFLLIRISCKRQLRQVRDRRTKKPLSWWQVLPTYTLPRWHSKTRGYEIAEGWQCPICKQDGYSGEVGRRFQLVYKSSQLPDRFPHFAATWERIGASVRTPRPGRIIGYANPLILVSVQVKKLFEEFGTADMYYEPVYGC